jgi:hypothetical protein
MMIGSSQYFLRARIKAQSSFRNDIKLKLICHALRRRTGRLALDPVCFGGCHPAQRQELLANQPEQQSGWCQNQKKHHPKYNWTNHTVQQPAEPEPNAIERRHQRRTKQTGGQEKPADGQGPPANTVAMDQWRAADYQEHRRENKPKGAIRRAFDLFRASQIFVDICHVDQTDDVFTS